MSKRISKTYGPPADRLPGVTFKALDDEAGSFEAFVSVFGNVDLQNDRVVKGAFSKSLDQWQRQGDPIPIIWSHDWADPFAHIGQADPNLAEETDVGLKLMGTFDVQKPFARQVYDLVKENRVREWSFAYDVVDEQRAKDGANELRVLNLIEAGPTLKGANDQTFTVGVKSALEKAAAKAGRSLSARNEALIRQARDLLEQMLVSLETPDEGDGKAFQEWLDAEKAHQEASKAPESPSEATKEVSEYQRRLALLLADVGL